MIFSSRSDANVCSSILPKASLVGAKTVKGPSACNASTKLAAFNATTRVEKSLLLTATSTIVPKDTGGAGASSTDSVEFDGS